MSNRMSGDLAITIEFYGIVRQRAGQAACVISAANVAEVLTGIALQFPALSGLTQPDGSLSPHYLLSINGERFISELGKPLQVGDRVLLLSADAGG
jgi:molybdopterin converting factor small subunit